METNLDDDFINEAMDLLDSAEESIMAICSDQDADEAYKIIFRTFHSLKGAAGMMGFLEVQGHMHLLEDQLDNYQTKPQEIKDVADYFLKGIDVARSLIRGENATFSEQIDKKEPKASNTKAQKPKDSNEKVKIADGPTCIYLTSEKNVNSEKVRSAFAVEHAYVCDSIESAEQYLRQHTSCLVIATKEFKHKILDQKALVGSKVVYTSGFSNENKIIVDDTNEFMNDLVETYTKLTKHTELLDRSITLMMYQFNELLVHFDNNNKNKILSVLKKEIENISKYKIR